MRASTFKARVALKGSSSFRSWMQGDVSFPDFYSFPNLFAHREQPESKNEDPCSLVTCFNGGFCVIDGNTAGCKCATGWRGRACNDQITINSSPTNQSEDEDLQDTLLLEKDSITVDSVTIQVPQLGAEYLIRVLELTDDRGGLLERQSYHIRPIKRNQRVSGLASCLPPSFNKFFRFGVPEIEEPMMMQPIKTVMNQNDSENSTNSSSKNKCGSNVEEAI